MKRFLPLFLCLCVAAGHSEAGCNPAFTATVQGATVQLQAAEAGPGISHSWRIAGVSSVYGSPASYTFVAPGTYTVTHYVHDSLNFCNDSLVKVIDVNFPVTCAASFTVAADSFQTRRFTFHSASSTSSGVIIQYKWTIDGVNVTGSATLVQNLTPGSHTICLTIVSSNTCTASTCQTVTVPADPVCNWEASFTATASPTNPRIYSFSAQPSISGLRYKWNFGDGVISYSKNPGHTYVQAGNYNVVLVVSDTLSGCYDSSAQQLHVNGSPADSCTVDILWTVNPSNPRQVAFTAVSNQAITSQLWKFTNGSNPYDSQHVSIANPTYTFADTGYYIVCLYISTNTGCSGSICRPIRILEDGDGSRIAYYPNPATNTVSFTIELQQSTPVGIKIYDLGGTAVYGTQRQGSPGSFRVEIPVQQLKSGQYFIDIYYNGKRKKGIFQKM